MALFTAVAAGLSAATGLAITGAAVAGTVAVAGTAASISAQNRAMRAQSAAAATQQRMQQQQATRQRRQAIRAGMIQREQMRAQALALGASGSSGVAGGLTSLSSQLGANLGFGTMMSGLGQQYTSQTGQAAKFSGLSQLYGTIGQIGMQAMPYASQSVAPVPRNVQGIPIGPSGYPSL